MDRWEAVLELYNYQPDIDRYGCKVCNNKLYKTCLGVSKHIRERHIKEINEIRDKAIVAEFS